MGYNYEEIRPWLFTDKGQRVFLKIRDNVQDLLKKAGAVRMQEACKGVTGDTSTMLACVERLVELGEIRELDDPDAGQHRVFVKRGE